MCQDAAPRREDPGGLRFMGTHAAGWLFLIDEAYKSHERLGSWVLDWKMKPRSCRAEAFANLFEWALRISSPPAAALKSSTYPSDQSLRSHPSCESGFGRMAQMVGATW